MIHNCKECEGKIPFIKVNQDGTYECEFCNKILSIDEIFGNNIKENGINT